MSSKKEIVVKTDASTRVGDGSGLAYVASVYKESKEPTHLSDSRFIEKDMSTTNSETLAVLYALHEIYNQLHRPETYNIVIESDCDPTVQRIRQEGVNEIEKPIDHYKKLFNGFDIRWIPRASNQQADDMAWIEFQRGINND
jgi:hypothetical protein